MDCRPQLVRITKALVKVRLEAILIGNAAAALHGAPVTTLDFDFMFRPTPLNIRKLKQLAKALDTTIFRPFYPVSDLYRIMSNSAGLQLDFLPFIHGVRSFESLRSRAVKVDFEGATLLVAALEDIIKSKRAAGRDKDFAVLPVLRAALDEQKEEK